MIDVIHTEITGLLRAVGVEAELSFHPVPNPSLGDIAVPCFSFAKVMGKNPAEVAKELVEEIECAGFIQRVVATGPYLNFFIDETQLGLALIAEILEGQRYGEHMIGEGKHLVIEYACPNPLKAFHLGHLKNLVTGESIVRIMENAGYDVTRVNYQGDVGLHIGKALWGIFHNQDAFDAMRQEPHVAKRVEFLGRVYAEGSAQYESGDEGKNEVEELSQKVYFKDEGVMEVYQTARQWSLEYFDTIYARLGTQFDRFYFESEMYERAVELVREGVKKEIFRQSEGAVIYEGEQRGLHDRVFLNSKGLPTYEAKDLALAEKHMAEFHPDQIVHVVGKEQTEYFKVLFLAIGDVFPDLRGKEHHVIGGFLQLKGEEKMSSRKGTIITGDALLALVRERVQAIMSESDKEENEEITEKVTVAALKYAMLRSNVSKDVAFDMEESISTSGSSGPYLLYTLARIKSIGRKSGRATVVIPEVTGEITAEERALLLSLAQFPRVTALAAETYDSSPIAQYLFELTQAFNAFYGTSPVLDADDLTKTFRLALLSSLDAVLTSGLSLLGIETLEEM